MIYVSRDYLAHHGIKGQKWGERRFQNEDGSLTPAGERRYGRSARKAEKIFEKALKKNSPDERMFYLQKRITNKKSKRRDVNNLYDNNATSKTNTGVAKAVYDKVSKVNGENYALEMLKGAKTYNRSRVNAAAVIGAGIVTGTLGSIIMGAQNRHVRKGIARQTVDELYQKKGS